MKVRVLAKDNIKYVRISDIPKDEKDKFRSFLRGSQLPSVDGEDPGNCAYAVDYWAFKTVINKIKHVLDITQQNR